MFYRSSVTALFISFAILQSTAFAQSAVAPGGSPQPGRFQLVVVPGHAGSPFMLDTATGCAWHLIQDEKTKRSTFIEVDVENLHWSWGSGAQQLLASRVDGSNLTDEQKRTLKQDLQKTGCGLSNVVLTPGMARTTGEEAKPEPAKSKKK
jgi:hypothetical protein